jgi:hypothetical protein
MNRMRSLIFGCASLLALVLSVTRAAGVELGHLEGRVLLRAESGGKPMPVKSGHALAFGAALITGDASRFEVATPNGGCWRVGRRALFVLNEKGARLLAGTALVRVPSDAVWQVESLRSRIALPAGTWLVQAMDNRGFKVVCLDASESVLGLGESSAPAEPPVALRLRPGELAFLQPGGRSFSPVVTVYLEELLATSRLVNGFPTEFPEVHRLMNQAVAQRERLKRISNAVVVGAPEAGGFQIAVPQAK